MSFAVERELIFWLFSLYFKHIELVDFSNNATSLIKSYFITKWLKYFFTVQIFLM